MRATRWPLWLAFTASGLALELPVGVPDVSQAGRDGTAFKPAPELSFSAPFDAVNQWIGERYIHSWEAGGAAMVHRNFARLTSDAQGHQGWFFNRVPCTFQSWSVVMKFRVSGRSTQLFGDGMALWFVKQPEHLPGSVFGREDMWDGLGIFFDTFQNVDMAHHQRHPYISVVPNDGTQHYNPTKDTMTSAAGRSKHVVPGKREGSGCSFDFRYSEMRDDFSVQNTTYAHIHYSNGHMSVSVRQSGDIGWEDCVNFDVGPLHGEHYFGLSAATGDLVDNHDVLSFNVYNWDEWDQTPEPPLERMVTHAVHESDAALLDLQHPKMDMRLESIVELQQSEIQRLRTHLALLQHRLEYELSAVHRGITHAKDLAESHKRHIDAFNYDVIDGVQNEMRADFDARLSKATENLKSDFEKDKPSGFGWQWWFLLILIAALFVYGHNRYNKIMKTHFL